MVNYCGTEFLKTSGYQVTSCLGTQETLEVFKANPQTFQMLITDYTMPNLTGPQLMEKIKAIRSDVPMLLITRYSNLATPENLKEWCCDEIIAKSYDVKKLSQAVSQALAKAKS